MSSTDPSPSDGSDPIETSRMLTHVVFHPVQKAQNSMQALDSLEMGMRTNWKSLSLVSFLHALSV